VLFGVSVEPIFLCWTVTVLLALGLKRIFLCWAAPCCGLWVWNDLFVFGGNCAVGCGAGNDWLCCRVSVFWAPGLEKLVRLDRKCAVGCGCATDWF
jgi:hypothetical protein